MCVRVYVSLYIIILLCGFNTPYIPKYTNGVEFSIKEASTYALKHSYKDSPFILVSIVACELLPQR